jgi:putative transposase
VLVTYETVREWCHTFGSLYAARLIKKRSRFGAQWHLDEVFIKRRTDMRQIIAALQVSVDGFIEGPNGGAMAVTGVEGATRRGWSGAI